MAQPTAIPRARRVASLVLVAVAAAAATWAVVKPHTLPDAPVVRTILDLPPGETVQSGGIGTAVALSPTGDLVAYLSNGPTGDRASIRRTDELLARIDPWSCERLLDALSGARSAIEAISGGGRGAAAGVCAGARAVRASGSGSTIGSEQ